MANTYTQIYIQVVFAVGSRQSLILRENKEELHKYITGIVSRQNQKLIAINSMPDHVHILIGLRPDMALSSLVREIKASSSKFINDRRWIRGRFNWQEGFGAFSYAHSQLNAVIRYIENQEQHHNRRSFKEEYLNMLKRFAIAYEDRYVFDFIEAQSSHAAPTGLDQ
ncbi:MAG TPA: IS200/IS605 family transposase [Pyrinomonadaceae bacterium]|jgi:REP element-mobilizing transposase RayT